RVHGAQPAPPVVNEPTIRWPADGLRTPPARRWDIRTDRQPPRRRRSSQRSDRFRAVAFGVRTFLGDPIASPPGTSAGPYPEQRFSIAASEAKAAYKSARRVEGLTVAAAANLGRRNRGEIPACALDHIAGRIRERSRR